MSETVDGTVSRLVYRAADGRFAVLRLAPTTGGEAVTVVGPLAGYEEGDLLRAEGSWELHPSHGRQLRVERVLPLPPSTSAGVQRYLAGLPGIGPTLARRLVDSFGPRAVEVLSDEPWRAALVQGVGKARAHKAAAAARERRAERDLAVFLHGLGLTAAQGARIRRAWGDLTVARLRQNPYLLAREVGGFGFLGADQIARRLGIGAAAPQRIEAAIHHTLTLFLDEGHVFAAPSDLLPRAGLLLAQLDGAAPEPAVLREALQGLAAQRAVVVEEEAVYLPALHGAEIELAAVIARLARQGRPGPPPVAESAGVDGVKLAPGQREAVALARRGGVGVITGGPGTGKTTVVRTIVATWVADHRRVLLAAPTGRAAQRLAEATGRPAQTIHRLLEWGRGGQGPGSFARSAAHPLDGDLVVVDESSMLDLPLAHALVTAVPTGATLLLVGDADQLPSVGPGQVLADLIASGIVPVVRLGEVFRQGEGSHIVDNAHRVRRGEMPEFPAAKAPGGPVGDFFFARADDPTRARELVVRLCRDRIPEAFGLDARRDIQVLSPMHRGEAGTEALNRALQAALNPDGLALPRGDRPSLRVGDKVLQSRNDYEREVWNGDIGQVAAVDTGPSGPAVTVRFDEREVRYEGEATGDLELAYAVSVHKSQGSEYPAVVVTILPQHFLLLRRNLLYTALTRGRRLVVLVGDLRSIRRAVDSGEQERRRTRLRERLIAAAATGSPA